MDFLQQKQDLFNRQEEHAKEVKNSQQFGNVDVHPELSLGPSRHGLLLPETTNSSSSDSDTKASRKRKCCWDHINSESRIQTSIELQVEDSLPLDWEQCLDLKSGRLYYLNRNTMKKSWKWPNQDQKLDLELNISTVSSSTNNKKNSVMSMDSKKRVSSSSSMVAVACMKCHLLVMLCRSSPSCPNCKYVHSLLAQESLVSQNPVKPFNTLSLLN